MSERQRILEAWKARLATTGYLVVLGEVGELGPDDPDRAIVITVGDDQVKAQGDKLFVTLPVHLSALAKADLDAPWTAIEDVLAAMKAAVETEDHRLGRQLKREITRGTTRTLPREPGSMTVGVAITYDCSYEETWGRP